MLVLSRKLSESIVIDDTIVVTVLELGRGRVRLGIEAPASVPVHRQEVMINGNVPRRAAAPAPMPVASLPAAVPG
ncbi:MAG: carbon storage regulator [Pirellulales bacterium]|nr:carbon storage regulator [Pirellulales bacterium]